MKQPDKDVWAAAFRESEYIVCSLLTGSPGCFILFEMFQ